MINDGVGLPEKPRRYVPRTDLDFAWWVRRFGSLVLEDAAELGVSEERAQEMVELAAAFFALNREQEALKLRLRSKTLEKDQLREKAEALARSLAQEIRANDGVEAPKLCNLGLSGRKTRSRIVRPRTPHTLHAMPNLQGYVDLVWDGNGNRPGVVYLIERRSGKGGAFEIVGSSTATRYRVKNQRVGEEALFRVRAQRRGELSGYTNIAYAYARVDQTPVDVVWAA